VLIPRNKYRAPKPTKTGRAKGYGPQSFIGPSIPAHLASAKATKRRIRNTGFGSAAVKAMVAKAGSWVGIPEQLSHSVISVFGGSGDYQELRGHVRSNSLLGVITPGSAQIPAMHSTGGSTRVSHRELIGDLPMTAAFTRTSFTVNPTNRLFFPWLANIAEQFQEWAMLGLVVELRSTSSVIAAGTNPGLGTVSAAFQYDVYSNLPTSKIQVANSQYAVSGPPNASLMIPLECDPSENASRVLHISQGQSGLDRHFYDFARLDIVTQGAQADFAGAMEVWVTYDVLLIKPDLDPAAEEGGSDLPCCHARLSGTSNTVIMALDTSLYAQPDFNTARAIFSGNLVSFPSTLPVGWYQFTLAFSGAATASLGFGTTSFFGGFVVTETINGTAYHPWKAGTGNSYRTPNGTNTACTNMIASDIMFYDGTGTPASPPSIAYNVSGAAVLPGTPNGADFTFTAVNRNLIGLSVVVPE